jgi:hypothetical protein
LLKHKQDDKYTLMLPEFLRIYGLLLGLFASMIVTGGPSLLLEGLQTRPVHLWLSEATVVYSMNLKVLTTLKNDGCAVWLAAVATHAEGCQHKCERTQDSSMPVTLDEVVHTSSRYINKNDVLLGSAETWIFDS